jgi:hypothetical protein
VSDLLPLSVRTEETAERGERALVAADRALLKDFVAASV